MCLYAPISDSECHKPSCVAALGCFDGLHAGHRLIIGYAKKQASRLGLPLTVYSPESRKGQPLLMTPAEKTAALYALGADAVILADFDHIKDSYFKKWYFHFLINELNIKHID